MTPKEKAKELFNDFQNYSQCSPSCNWKRNTKRCVVRCVDEMITELNNLNQSIIHAQRDSRIKYWGDVKQEIEKL